MAKYKTLQLTGPSGEIYTLSLFPGFGTTSEEAARGNHGHLASEIAETIDKLFASPAEKTSWNDKYTKLEIDNKLKGLVESIDWKESVNTFADIATTYPTPEKGWTVNTKTDNNGNGSTYRYNGLEWVNISGSGIIPVATALVDGLMSKESFIRLSNLVSFPGFGATADLAARGDHNHAGVYQPIGDYAAAVHSHLEVAGLGVGTENNNEANKLVRTDAAGKIIGQFKLTNTDNDTATLAAIPYVDSSGNLQRFSPAAFRAKITDTIYAPIAHTHDAVAGLTISNNFGSTAIDGILAVSGATAYKFAADKVQAFLNIFKAADFTGANILAQLINADGAGSNLDADQLDGLHGSQYLFGTYHKPSFTNGYLIKTSIATIANATALLEIAGEMVANAMPLYQVVQIGINATQGKLENFAGMLLSGANPVEVTAFSYNSLLYFFIPKVGVGQALRFYVRSSKLDTESVGLMDYNQIVDITDASIPVGTAWLTTLSAANNIKAYNSSNLNIASFVLNTDSRLTDARQAKDVYAWAKAATKPTYGASEIKFTDNQTFQEKLDAGLLKGKSAYQAFLDGGGTGLTEAQFNAVLSTYANKFDKGTLPATIVSAQNILEKIGIDQNAYVETLLATTGNAYIDSLPAASKTSIIKFLQLLVSNKLDIRLSTSKVLMGVNDVATETDAVYEWTVGASIPGQKEVKGLITEMVVSDGSIIAMPNIFIKNVTLTATGQIQLLSDSYTGRYYVIESISLIARGINITQSPIFSIGCNASSYTDIAASQVMSGIKNGLNTVVLTTGAWSGLVQANSPMFLNITQAMIGSGTFQLVIKGYLTSI